MHKESGKSDVRRGLLSVRFVLSAVILAAAALGLRPGMAMLSKYYAKETIGMKRSLRKFDTTNLAGFQKEWKLRTEETADEIGTEEYVIVMLARKYPSEGLKTAYLTAMYYSDPRDKVAHTPDVCYRQAGAIVKAKTAIQLDLPGISSQQTPVQATLVDLKVGTGNRIVIFFFVVEGKFRRTREQVRWVLGMPGNKYCYFAKIEASATYPKDGDPSKATEIARQLLAESTPVLLDQYLPDTGQLGRR
ncbi:MAG: hypothetical protein J7M40_04110 [Planctomycetes bacterium]|nr:hypothetical protein [Planctomycetota bacterium]